MEATLNQRARIITASLCAVLAAGSPLPARAASAPLAVGSAAPSVSLLINGKKMSLKSLLAGNRNLVLFYPGSCSSCDTQLQAIDKGVIQALGRMGFAAFAVSPDLPSDQAKTVARLALPYTVLSDPNGAAAQAFHVAGSAAFLIDADGTVRFVSNLDQTPLKGPDLIAAAKALKRASRAKP